MSWQDEMKAALIGYVISHGGLVKESAVRRDYGSWQEYGWDEATQEDVPALTRHMRTCAAGPGRSSYEDSAWEEFDGTFAEPPWSRRTGTDAIVFCVCGEVRGRRWRYTGGLAYLIRAITTEQEAH